MKLKLIACKVLTRELSYLIARSPNMIDVTYLRQGYHENPDSLREILQGEIDAVESGEDSHTNRSRGSFSIGESEEDFDAILLGYGLCSNSVIGITAKRHKLVIPRAHDCITLFMGAKETYRKYFSELPGCYWYTDSWIENSRMPCEAHHRDELQRLLEKGYEEDEAEFVLEEIGGLRNYKSAAYIQMPCGSNPEHLAFTKSACEFFHWNFHRLDGSIELLRRFTDGEWNEEDFLVLEPGEKAAPSYDEKILKKQEEKIL